MRQAQRIQHWLVRGNHRARGHSQPKANLFFQLEKILVAKNSPVHVAANSLKDADNALTIVPRVNLAYSGGLTGVVTALEHE
jgi:hypothetical protein